MKRIFNSLNTNMFRRAISILVCVTILLSSLSLSVMADEDVPIVNDTLQSIQEENAICDEVIDTKNLPSELPTDDVEQQPSDKLLYDIGETIISDSFTYESPITYGAYTYVWPVSINARINQYFGGSNKHGGVDFNATIGTEIHAIAAGTVVRAEYHSSWGNYTVIDHGGNVYSLYAHQKSGGFRVSVGDWVRQGQVIGLSGNTGNVTGPHLHLEMWRGGYGTSYRVDPQKYLSKVNPWDVNPPITPPTLEVWIGDNVKDTIFTWYGDANATNYVVKIWNGTVWEGSSYHESYASERRYSVQLPPGYYEAYVDAVNSDGGCEMSNIVKFTVPLASKYEDLGTDFYAVILHTKSWKPLTLDDDNYVRLHDEKGVAHQVWYFRRQSDGSYTIANSSNNRLLEMYWGGLSNGTPVSASAEDWGGNYQRWYIYTEGDGYRFVSRHYPEQKRSLDVSNDDGTTLQTWDTNVHSNQIFSIYRGDEITIKAPTLSVQVATADPATIFSWNDIYGESAYDLFIKKDGVDYRYVRNASSTTSYSEILPPGNYTAFVGAVNAYTREDSNVVSFTVTKSPVDIGSDKYVKIEYDEFNKFVTCADNVAAIYDENKSCNQVWRLIRQSNGSYKILNAATDLALSVNEQVDAVVMKPDESNDSQLWNIYQYDNEHYIIVPINAKIVSLEVSGHINENGTILALYNVLGASKLFKISDTETIAHIWDDGNVTKAATCTEDGIKTYTCTACEKTKIEFILAKGHSFSTAWQSDNTNHWHVCSRCNEKGSLAAHTWDTGKVTKAATETSTGIKTYTCTVCKKTKTETIPKLAHTHKYGTAWQSDDTNHWHVCSGCNEKGSLAAHTWDAGKVTKAATETSTGIKTYTCTVCQKTKTEIIPISNADVKLTNASASKGQKVILEVVVNKPINVTALMLGEFEYDKKALTLDYKGIEICTDSLIKDVNENSGILVGFNSTTKISGTIIKIPFTISQNAGDGNYAVGAKMKYQISGSSETFDVLMPNGIISVSSYKRGDTNGDDIVNAEDAIHLMWHTFNPTGYPVTEQKHDYNKDGIVNAEDAIYLMWYTFVPNKYPLD